MNTFSHIGERHGLVNKKSRSVLNFAIISAHYSAILYLPCTDALSASTVTNLKTIKAALSTYTLDRSLYLSVFTKPRLTLME